MKDFFFKISSKSLEENGPYSYYPNKVVDSSPPPKPPVTLIEEGIARMTLEETRERRGFATSPGRSVRQHSVRDKGKEDTCHLPYAKQ